MYVFTISSCKAFYYLLRSSSCNVVLTNFWIENRLLGRGILNDVDEYKNQVIFICNAKGK